MAIDLDRNRDEEVSIPTASLADIVFLLLVFFLVSTSMNPNKGVGLTLPPKGEQVKINPDNVLSIFVNKEGKILIEDKEMELSQVEGKVKKELSKNEKLIISLLTHKQASYKTMVDVLDEVKQADAERISLAVPHF